MMSIHGKYGEDKMTTIVIDVTAEDLEKGKPDACDSCAVARALRRVWPQAQFWNDAFQTAPFVIFEGGGVIVNSSPELAQYGRDFDHGRPLKPRQFKVRVPERLVPA